MKLIVAIALCALVASASAGDSYGSKPCKAKGMFSANTGDVVKFIQAAGVAPYFDFGACLYIYVFGPTNIDIGTQATKISSIVNSLSTSAIAPSSSDVTAFASSIFDDCVIRDIELNYLCVGSPPGVYTDPRTGGGRKLLGDDDYNKGTTFPFFTRIATSVTIKARYNFDGYGWKKATFNIDVCIDINRSGTFGLPGDGDLLAPCGELSFTDY